MDQHQCIICNSLYLHPCYPPEEKDDCVQVFKTMCKFLQVELDNEEWDFESEDVPLCKRCYDIGSKIRETDKEIDCLQYEIVEHTEVLKVEVRKCTKKDISSFSGIQNESCEQKHHPMVTRSIQNQMDHPISQRFTRFRKQVLKNESTRHIGTRRLTDIAGFASTLDQSIPIYDGTVSQSSVDNLSCLDEGQATISANQNESQANPVPVPTSIEEWFRNELDINFDLELFEDTEKESGTNPGRKWTKRDEGLYYEDVRVYKPPARENWTCGHEGCSFVVPSGIQHPKKCMAYHILTRHKGFKKCPALNCEKFFDPQAFEIHIASNHNNSQEDLKPLTCSYPNCNKTYKSKNMLKVHEYRKHKIEIDERAESKAIFDKKYGPGTNPFKCPECDKTFRKKFNLNRHIKLHTSDKGKTEICDQCGKTFSKDVLCGHIREVHKIIKKKKDHCTFNCGFGSCILKFPTNARLNKHIKKCHTKNKGKNEVEGAEGVMTTMGTTSADNDDDECEMES